MGLDINQYFEILKKGKKEERIPTPTPRVWTMKHEIKKTDNRTVIPSESGWVLVLQVGSLGSEVYNETGYLKPKKKGFEEGVTVYFMRKSGKIRCGVPFNSITLKDGKGFGFAAYMDISIKTEKTFFRKIVKDTDVLYHYDISSAIRVPLINCIATELKNETEETIESNIESIQSRIPDLMNEGRTYSNLPTDMGVRVGHLNFVRRKYSTPSTEKGHQ